MRAPLADGGDPGAGWSPGARAAVLVVGAGPVGLTLACHLRRLGLPVRIVEKREGPSTTSKAIGLQYRVSEVLARLGIVDRFLERGGSPTVINLYERERRLVRMRFRAPESVSGRDAFLPRAILLPQSETERILVDFLAELGCAVEWGTEFLDYRQEADRVLSRIREAGGREEEVASAWLVSCEGAHSSIRKRAGIAFAGKTYPLAFFMADLRLDWDLDHDENHVWLHPDGSLAALPLPSPRTWRLFVEIPAEPEEPTEGLDLEAVRRLLRERTGEEPVVRGEPLWISEFRIACRMVDRMREGRVFLAGDAAHIHSPTGGQGITTGVQDAANLAWKLARVAGGAPEALLDTYEEERLPHAAEVLRETDRTTTLLFAPNPALRLLRDALVLPVLRSERVQRRMFGKFSQLHVHYRRSSLSREELRPRWPRPRIRAGDRAPDVAFGTGEGDRTTLFELMADPRPVVLIGEASDRRDGRLRAALSALDLAVHVVASEGDGSGSAAEGGPTPPWRGHRLVDLHGDLRRLYGLTHDFVCVLRPDGHVGFLGRPAREASLEDYLRRICPPGAVERGFA